jgi:hypothetical protein
LQIGRNDNKYLSILLLDLYPLFWPTVWFALVRVFSDVKVHVGKLTHIWRAQGEQELDESGISIVSIGCMMGHAVESLKKRGMMKAQSQSYITNPPTYAVVGQTGGNWRNPCEHCLPHEMVVVSYELMNGIPQVAELISNY